VTRGKANPTNAASVSQTPLGTNKLTNGCNATMIKGTSLT